jgi:hypothetical protein
MERKNRYLLTITLALGLVGARIIDAHQKGGGSSIFNSQIPTTFEPTLTIGNLTEEILASPMVLPSLTAVIPSETFAPPFLPTAEIPFGGHECVLPLAVPFKATTGYLEQLKDKDGKPLFYKGLPERHPGTDLGNIKEGDSVYNICDSELFYSGPTEGEPGLGNVVVVKDVSTGNYILFAHLSSFIHRAPGERIIAGDEIGKAGYSGGWEEDDVHVHISVLTGYALILIMESTRNSYGNDFSKSLTPLFHNLETISDEEIAKRLIDPAIFIYRATRRKIW